MTPGPIDGFPLSLDRYTGEEGLGLTAVLTSRATADPLNLAATVIFVLAILHSFAAPSLTAASHRLRSRLDLARGGEGHSFAVELLHFLGEVEAVFGVWVIPLLVILAAIRGARAAEQFLGGVQFTEPLFVVVIMAMASTRPVLAATEQLLGLVARLGGGTPLAWWLSVLTLGPLLGSFITEPAAMVICAMLLGKRVFDLEPGATFRYATLGLLFVDVSVGGTLTNFAAPPVLMVAGTFGWDAGFMMSNFGWKAVVGIVVANAAYALAFRKEFAALDGHAKAAARGLQPDPESPVPPWIVGVHLLFLGLAVYSAHTPAVFIGAFLFFLAFQQATAPHQQELDLRPPMLVGFFLAGLVIHGAGQQWWIAPVLSRLADLPLFLGAIGLTSFNDNAAITYLASLVPGLGPSLRYAVVAGAVVGGGLTVIANAPNPAGQSALARYFPEGVAPAGLLAGALLPTVVMAGAFWLLP